MKKIINFRFSCQVLLLLLIGTPNVYASENILNLHATSTIAGISCLIIFVLSYVLVMTEEVTQLRKSKPVVLAAGIIWILVSYICTVQNLPHAAEEAVRGNLLEYIELFLFLLVAMTYVNTMEERNIFMTLRSWLVNKGFSFRQCFWVTGILAFFISPIADNLTTALLMCAVVMALGSDNPKFVGISCINIVVASNAGGAFSPFGDITTLMVWQKNILQFQDFFHIFIPSVVNFLIPSAIMHFAIPKISPAATKEKVTMKIGAKRVIILFLLTILTSVLLHHLLNLPPTIGMMTGLGYLFMFSYYLKKSEMALERKKNPKNSNSTI